MADKPMTHLWKKWPVLILAAVIALVLGVTTWANLSLESAQYTYASQTAYVYRYELTQTPGKSISGRTTVYRFRISEDGKPVSNHKVKVGVSHAYGIGVQDRNGDVYERESVTDANGFVEVTHAPKFWSLLADKGFGVYAAPLLTPAEAEIRRQKLVSGDLKNSDINWASTFSIPAIYPRWLSWFIWR
ncbi:MAG: hypothetical protein JWN01_108 [Patescibacteria group bacterium]|nr:hypothetical protein [Patescibacteria group bacterium]